MNFIGIDPGITGAVAVLSGDHAQVYDMPTMPYGKTGRKALNLPLLSDMLAPFEGTGARAFVEKVNAMPGQGVSSMFSMGMSFYGACGVLAGLNIPVTLVRPQTWKAYYGLGRDKENSRALAIAKFPGVSLKLKKDHGKAEALLIAHYGRLHS